MDMKTLFTSNRLHRQSTWIIYNANDGFRSGMVAKELVVICKSHFLMPFKGAKEFIVHLWFIVFPFMTFMVFLVAIAIPS